MKKIVLLTLVICFVQLHLFAQTISGTIVNQSGEPIPGATVLIERSFHASTSNSAGFYSFSKLKPGNYVVKVDFLGYEGQIKEIELQHNSLILNFVLTVSENLTDEVVVSAFRVGKKSPIATTEIESKDLDKRNLGQDVPYLLGFGPSVTTSSDAGSGIGYSKLSIRGTDMTRINVTINGIPLNDSESHGVYWVNLPDLSSSVKNIQIQRGVGSSTYGAASFGANINFATNQLEKEAYAQLSASYGSFNSSKLTLKAGTGLLNKHLAFDLRLSKIHSDGYIDRARSDMGAFFISSSWSDAKTLFRLNLISGQEETYQAWNGVPKVRLENDLEGMKRYQDHWLYSEEETLHMINSNSRTYNFYTYDNEIDNYNQTHYQGFISRELAGNFMLNLAFNYTKGFGYFEQYKKSQRLADYDMVPIETGGQTISRTDLIRQKWLDNDFYVLNFTLEYKKPQIKATIGGSWQDYFGKHFGKVIWARHSGLSEKDHQWYFNTGDKKEYNAFGKLEFLLADRFNLYADMQYRRVDYTIRGIDDDLKDIGQEHVFNFFNPKFGLNYNFNDRQQIYSSFGIANREPSRTDFKDAINDQEPKHETLRNYELGYTFSAPNLLLNLNLYYMDYLDQLVKTGKINDVGDAIMTNIPESYRAGIEFSSKFKLNQILNWSLNTTLSRNKLDGFTEFVDNWDEGGQIQIPVGKSNLSFSPELILGSEIELNPFNGFQIAFISKYVGKQYIDNSSSIDRMIDAYFVNHIRLNYRFETKHIKTIDLQLLVNNIFNTKYETDAWAYRYFYNNAYYNMDGYFPQAGTNFMAGIVIGF
jgi:iron complex outermembrane recepter protein